MFKFVKNSLLKDVKYYELNGWIILDCSIVLPDIYLNIGNTASSWFTISSKYLLRDVSVKQDKSVCGLRIKSN